MWFMVRRWKLIDGEMLGFRQANLQDIYLLLGLEPLQDFGRDRVQYGMLGGEGLGCEVISLSLDRPTYQIWAFYWAF